jgi:hypothetical protein
VELPLKVRKENYMRKENALFLNAFIFVVLSAFFSATYAQEGKSVAGQNKKPIPAGSKVYVAPMKDGFETFVIAGIIKKQVPVVVVNSRDKADYEITGISESEKAGWAKMLFLGSQQSNEEASIKVADLKTDEVVYGYSVHKGNSYRGRQSAGEACAKHLKENIASNEVKK